MPEADPSNALQSPPSRAREWTWVLLLLLFLPALWAGLKTSFYFLDDYYLKGHALIHEDGSWFKLLQWRLSEPFYYPLSLITWKLDLLIWEPLLRGWLGESAWPAGIRITNTLLHLGGAYFLFRALRALEIPVRYAAGIMAIFALHPIVCESVLWAIERKSVLAGFFAFLALWLYFRATTWRGRLLAALPFACGLLSKPSALSVLPVIIVWYLLGRPRGSQTESVKANKVEMILGWIPWVLLSVGAIGINVYNHKENLVEPPGGSLFTALLTDVVILYRYVENFIYPGNLSYFYYVQPVTSLADSRLWICGAILVALVAFMLWLATGRYRRIALFGWLWFLGGLGPNLNLISVNDIMHDRYVYLATPGFWLALSMALAGAVERLKIRGMLALTRPALGLAGLGLLAIGLAYGSFARATIFSDPLTLAVDTAKKEPQSSGARIMLGNLLRMEGVKRYSAGFQDEGNQLLDAAIIEIKLGIASPDFQRFLDPINAYVSLGVAFNRRGNYREAAPCFQYALNPPPGRKPLATDLGVAEKFVAEELMRLPNPIAALDHFDRALKAIPEDRSIHIGRAQAFVLILDTLNRDGKSEDAWRFYRLAEDALNKILPSDPSYISAQNMLHALKQPSGPEPIRVPE